MAGRIPRDWLDNARVNEAQPDHTVEVWFATALNVAEVEIDDDGSVAVASERGGPMVWLAQEAIDDAIWRIEAGV